MNEEELNYLAGLFDGEGCIQIAHNKPQKGKRTEQHTLTCRVAMTNKETVEYFLVFGGGIHIKRASKGNPKWKDQYAWTVSSNKALRFLEQMRPYLRLRQPEADCGIQFQLYRRSSPYGNGEFGWGRNPITKEELERREWFREELRRLKDSRFPLRSWYNDERTRTMVA